MNRTLGLSDGSRLVPSARVTLEAFTGVLVARAGQYGHPRRTEARLIGSLRSVVDGEGCDVVPGETEGAPQVSSGRIEWKGTAASPMEIVIEGVRLDEWKLFAFCRW